MAEAFRFALGRCGVPALGLLHGQAPLRVAAVFDRSFYLEAGGAFACLGGREIELGPLNGRLDTPKGMSWPASGLREGARCRRSPDAIHLGGRFVISLSAARAWRPQPAPARPDPSAVLPVLERVRRVGLGRTALDGMAEARGPTACAGRWLATVFGAGADGRDDERGWVSRLIGLGPGLTPSGDDYLGGIMVALQALCRPEAAGRLAALSLPLAASGSNAISAAHLAAAAKGQGSASLHRLMNDVLRGDPGRIDARTAAVGRIGHSSGWDSLAGVVAVLDAWSTSGARRSGLARRRLVEV